VDLVESVPDQTMIVEVEPAGERDLRTRRKHDFGIGPALGGDEVSAVDHRCCHRAMAEFRPGARLPVRSGVPGEMLCGLVAEVFYDVTSLDQCQAFGD